MTDNVLAARYASPEMRHLWDPATKIRLERELWITVLESQHRLGLQIDPAVIDDYRRVSDQVDLASIEARERVLRHDVKARIEEFNALAGREAVHLGMTSRDVTENVELLQIRRSLELMTLRAVSALEGMARVAAETAEVPVTARTHNVPAQVTTVGKRVATAGEELIIALEHLEAFTLRLPVRGIKGPVGTQQDQADLLGSADAASALDQSVAASLGFTRVMGSVGQIYPRSLDFEVVSTLVQLAAGPVNLANTLRLMAGHDLATEGFQRDQVGSSAMPHKVNARTSERIHGFKVILTGHLAMASGLAGEQWNEGDVSCSVVRRVMLPDAFFAVDGLFQCFLAVLEELGLYPAMIQRELVEHLPFLATTRVLVAAVQAGMGREEAHRAIQRHSAAAIAARRGGDASVPSLFESLAEDPDIPLSADDLSHIAADPLSSTGLAGRQVEAFLRSVAQIVARHPSAAGYRPRPII